MFLTFSQIEVIKQGPVINAFSWTEYMHQEIPMIYNKILLTYSKWTVTNCILM